MNKLFFTWSGIGDNLILLAAAYNIYKKTGEKVYIASKLNDFLPYCENFVNYLNLFSFEDLYSPPRISQKN